MTSKSILAAVAAAVALTAASTTTAAASHNTQISCYAYVHGQCYGNGENNCSQEDYEWGLDQCDDYYSEAPARTMERPKGLANVPSKRGIKMQIQSTFKAR